MRISNELFSTAFVGSKPLSTRLGRSLQTYIRTSIILWGTTFAVLSVYGIAQSSRRGRILLAAFSTSLSTGARWFRRSPRKALNYVLRRYRGQDELTFRELRSPASQARLKGLESLRKHAAYRFSPLASEDAEIRLLYILPGDEHDPIRINLVHASLNDEPKFIALSYVWGDSCSRTPILVNGYSFHVATNLRSALSHLQRGRPEDLKHPFWIDALSIDQANALERRDQVLLMRDIYESALKVKVWLGPPTRGTELALAQLRAIEGYFVKRIYEAVEETREVAMPYSHSDEPWRRGLTSFDVLLWGDPVEEDSSRFTDPWEEVINVFHNSWFTRTWIAQEVSSHKTEDVEVILGRQMQTASLNTTVYMTLLMVSLNRNNASLKAWPRIGPLLEKLYFSQLSASRLHAIKATRLKRAYQRKDWLRFQILRLFQGTGALQEEVKLWRTDVLAMLRMFRGLQASDPRDKVYAAYALVLAPDHPAFNPDYSISKKQAFCNVFRAFLNYERTLAIMGNAAPNQTDLPSWIPDWTLPLDTYTLSFWLDHHDECIYQASGGSESDAVIDDTETILTASGVLVDTITILGSKFDGMQTLYKGLWEMWRESKLPGGIPCIPDHYHKTDESSLEAFKTTLMMDRRSAMRKGIVERSWAESSWAERVALILWIFSPRNFLRIHKILNQSRNVHEVSNGIYDELAFSVNEREGQRSVELRGAAVVWTDDKPFCEGTPESSSENQEEVLFECNYNRILCMTSSGYMALVPRQAQVHDHIVVLLGGNVPFVLRPSESTEEPSVGSQSSFRLVGECYVHGFMDGEIMQDLASDKADLRKFVLV